MSRDVALYVEDMVEACQRVLRYTEGLDRSGLVEGSMVHDAVLRNLEILGEAAKRVPPEVRGLAPAIAWRRMAGLRDVWHTLTSESTKTSCGTWFPPSCLRCCHDSRTFERSWSPRTPERRRRRVGHAGECLDVCGSG